MKLSDALDVRAGDVVVFVGAGGKTSAMFRLAAELSEQGLRVLTTTTTRIALDELRLATQHIGFGHGMFLPETLPDQLAQHRHVFVFTKIEPDNKVRGVRPSWLDENLAQAPFLDVLAVEADGSRRLPLKAPLPHEPAMPGSATIVVPVVGLDVLGQPLDEAHVYGAETMHRLTGHPVGESVNVQLVAAALMHPQVGLKAVPPGARIVPLLNKATPDGLVNARRIADYVLTDLNIERVLIGAVKEPVPVWEARRRVGAVILAAGESRRMGRPKMLLPWGSGTIIRHVCQQVIAAGVYEVVVVVGRWRDEIQAQIADLPLRIVYNPDFEQGDMLSSLQVGLTSLWYTSDACMVVLGDQPSIQPSLIMRLTEAFYQGQGKIVAPSYNNRRGHPLMLDRFFWQLILDLPAGGAPRDVLRANEDQIYHLVVDTESVLHDIDTPDDYQRALRGE